MLNKMRSAVPRSYGLSRASCSVPIFSAAAV
jgi:hypothetical protein